MPSQSVEVTVVDRTLVKASRPPPTSPPAAAAVSNIDLIIGSFHVTLVFVYPPHPAVSFSAVVDAVRAALPSFLDHFSPFAGRIVNDDRGLPAVLDDNSGAELVVAEAAAVRLSSVDFSDIDGSLGRMHVPFADDLALSVQLVRFGCGGFSLSWATNHLLVDGHGLASLPTSFAELLNSGGLSWEPCHGRSFLAPRSPPQFAPSLDDEFTRCVPDNLVNPLLACTLVRRLYTVDRESINRLCAAASSPDHRATQLEAISAHIWKLLASAVGGDDKDCRMAWIVDGRRPLQLKYGSSALDNYLGNVITYASRKASVEAVKSSPLPALAAAARAAILGVFSEQRFQELVDWMEVKKTEYGGCGVGKWTERVNVGVGSPSVVISSFSGFKINGDFGFGRPAMMVPWIRPGRMASAFVMTAKSPREDGSWVVSARLWPRLAGEMEGDAEGVFKLATTAALGLAAPASRL